MRCHPGSGLRNLRRPRGGQGRFGRAAVNAFADAGWSVLALARLRLEAHLFASLFATDDRRTGMQSFLENGPGKAVFTGR